MVKTLEPESTDGVAIIAGDDLDGLVEDKSTISVVVEDEEEQRTEDLLHIKETFAELIANAVADIIIKNMEDEESYTVEEKSFIHEEIQTWVEDALLWRSDFSQEAYEIWYDNNVGPY